MKILIMHHVESEWEHGLISQGTCLEEVVEKLHDHLQNNDYDRIYLTRFCASDFEWETEIFREFGARVEEYGYGWELDRCREDIEEGQELPDGFVEGGCHSEIVYVPEWVKALEGHEVHLTGAFKYECLEDMEVALNSVDANWKYLDHLCVG